MDQSDPHGRLTSFLLSFKIHAMMKKSLYSCVPNRAEGPWARSLGLIALFAVLTALVGSSLSAFQDQTDKQVKEDKEEKKEKKEEKRRKKNVQEESESAYKKWMSEEVPYIITSEERAAFKKFTTDDEREQFIEAFWERRNPNPGSPENEFKEEYYRRIAYANEHYASGIPGWKTDRGRIYIMYGPPDEIQSHPSGGTYERPPEEGGGETSTYPFEDWRYRYIEGIGENVELEFVDPTMTGEYHLTIDPGEKDALLHVPNAGLTDMEAMGMASKTDRFSRTDGMTIGTAMGGTPESMEEFTRLDLYAKIFQPPAVKFNDMKAVVTSKITGELLPFDVREDFIKVTDESVLTPITVQVADRDMEFQNKDGVMHAVLDIYARISTPSGRVVNTIEEGAVTDMPQHDYQTNLNRKTVWQKVLPLKPGLYKLTVVVKDDLSGHTGDMELGLHVPRYDDDSLSNSSLILADVIQPLPTNMVGSGPFVIGGTKVRPSVNNAFTRDQNLGIYMQVYNLGVDPKTHKPSAEVTYDIMKDGKAIVSKTLAAADIKNAAQQMTLEQQMKLQPLAPGKYTVAIQVKDNIKNQTISPSTTFTVQ